MRMAINAASIKNRKILLVKKRKTWILPGGKPKKNESDFACLAREVGEELPKTKIKIGKFCGTFVGETPHKNDFIRAKVYFAKISGNISPGAEINDAKWVGKITGLKLSNATAKIISALRTDGRL